LFWNILPIQLITEGLHGKTKVTPYIVGFSVKIRIWGNVEGFNVGGFLVDGSFDCNFYTVI
jgi:hypothetical protein